MTGMETGVGDGSIGARQLSGLGVALDAIYGALGVREPKQPDPGSAANGRRRCPTCGIIEGFDGRLHCPCGDIDRLLRQFMDGVRDGLGYRRDYQGFRELGGISIFWDNATIRRDVDDYEVVPGAFDVDLRFRRILACGEIALLEMTISERLYPAFVEVEREQSQEQEGTHFHVSVRFLD